MTALTQDRNTPYRQGLKYSYPVAASTKIYAGSIVMLDSSGNAVPATATTGLIPAGVADVQADNSAGAAAAISVDVFTGTFKFGNGDTITKSSIGDTGYAFDDNTVKKVSTGLSALGVITAVDSDGVWIDIGPGQTVQSTGLLAANNLSDVSSASTSASNLGLGAASNVQFNNIDADGTFGCDGVATFDTTIVAAGTTDSTSKTTGLVQIAGGVGIAKSLHVGTTISGSRVTSTQTATYSVSTPDVDGDSTIYDLTDNAAITLPAIAAANDGMRITLQNTAAAGAAKIQYTVTGADRICGTIGAVTVTAGSTLVNTKATANKGDYATLQANNALKLWFIVGGVGVWA